jgi:hypothetical protein
MSAVEVKVVHGEVGVLKEVHLHHKEHIQKCFLVIDYENQIYWGSLLFDDAELCLRVAKALRERIGRSIKDIADADLSSAV